MGRQSDTNAVRQHPVTNNLCHKHQLYWDQVATHTTQPYANSNKHTDAAMTKQSRRVTTTFQAHTTQTLPPVPLEWHVNTATSLYQTSIVFPMCNDHIVSCSLVYQLHTDMGQIMIVAKWLHGRSPTDLQTQLSRSQLWRGGKTTNSHDRTTQVHLTGTKYIHTLCDLS